MPILVALMPLVFVAAQVDKTKPPNIPALVQQLGADSREERDGASKTLEKIGSPALAELRNAMASTDAEIRRRAKRLLETIESKLFGERGVFDAEAGSVNGVAFSPDGRRAASADSRGVRLWDLTSGKLLARNDAHRDRVMAVAFSPDGKLLATACEDRCVRLLDAGKLSEVRELKRHKDAVRCVTFSQDGKRLLSAGFDGLVQEWDVGTGRPGAEATVRPGQFFAITKRPDWGRVLACLRNCNDVVELSLGSKGPVGQFHGHGKQVMSASVSRDGKRMVTGSHDATLRVWDVETRKCLHVLTGHSADVCAVAISPDGKRAVSGGHDKVLRLWDLENGRHIREMKGHAQVIWSVAYSADGKRALSGSHDGTMRLWAVGE